jgi:hypothetical protein
VIQHPTYWYQRIHYMCILTLLINLVITRWPKCFGNIRMNRNSVTCCSQLHANWWMGLYTENIMSMQACCEEWLWSTSGVVLLSGQIYPTGTPTGNKEGCVLLANERENSWKKLETLARSFFGGTDIYWNMPIRELQGTRFFFCRRQIPFNRGTEIKVYWNCKSFPLNTGLLLVQVSFKTGFTFFSDTLSEDVQNCVRYLIQGTKELE